MDLSELERVSEVPPLPFVYTRTYDTNLARFNRWRISPIVISGKENKPETDEDILKTVRREKEGEEWFYKEYWREKGLPQEQVSITVNNRQITLYNWCKEKPFTDEHTFRTKDALERIGSHFPQVLGKISWILIDNIPHPSAFGDPNKYPWNGNAMRDNHAFRFLPRGMELIPHRIQAISNFEGTFVHELTHLFERDFEKKWHKAGFAWDFCFDNKDDWETRVTPDGSGKRFYNKHTGEMAPTGMFPLQPDQCVNYYARGALEEDICESMVAYIYDPELLKSISLGKFEILDQQDAKLGKPVVGVSRVPQSEIRLPEIKPEIIYYYIKEPVNE